MIEGGALALMTESWEQNISMFLSISVHKIAIGVTMGFNLKSSKLKKIHTQLILLIWSALSSIGGIISFYGILRNL